jgi:predicted HTH domain antitoxin
VKLKHAYDVWNPRLFLVTTSAADSRTAHLLLPSSFHEMRPYLTIVPSWDLADFPRATACFGDCAARFIYVLLECKRVITISARIDEELAKRIARIMRKRGIDRSAAVRELLGMGLREYQLKEVLELVRERKITVWRAAEIAQVTYREMLDQLRERNVPFPVTVGEIARELEEIGGE